MSDPFFPTPANVKDYTCEDNYTTWSNFIGDYMTETVKFEELTVQSGKCQFYNPETKPPGKDVSTAVVTWNGFPRRLTINYPLTYLEVADRKSGWPHNGPDYEKARNQDEYLEWYVYKNDQDKISRVDFTCEGPEYWAMLFDWEPQTCLSLYQKFVSPDVKLDDLSTTDSTGKKMYDTYNKWNTTHGCMHLNCPPNSLEAEIRLAGDASIIRKIDGTTVTDSQQLINCSKYGRADRNSDPHIGSTCNTRCRDGKRITLANPVCLFIADIKTSGWTTPDNKDAAKYMKLVRGTKEQGLRYSLQVPPEENFTVGDIKIAGAPISFGGTVAFLIDVGLTAELCTNELGAQPAYKCVPETKESLLAYHTLGVTQPALMGMHNLKHRGENAPFEPCKC